MNFDFLCSYLLVRRIGKILLFFASKAQYIGVAKNNWRQIYFKKQGEGVVNQVEGTVVYFSFPIKVYRDSKIVSY